MEDGKEHSRGRLPKAQLSTIYHLPFPISSLVIYLFVPIVVQGPCVAAKAGGMRPLLAAARAEPMRFEGVPDVTAARGAAPRVVA